VPQAPIPVPDGIFFANGATTPPANPLATATPFPAEGDAERAIIFASHMRYRTCTQHVTQGDLAMSPDGQLIAINCGSLLEVFRASDSLLIMGYPHATGAFAFSSDSRLLAVGTSPSAMKKELVVWRMSDLQQVMRYDLLDASATNIAFAPDGTTLAFVASDGRVIFIDMASHAISADTISRDIPVSRIAFSPDGRYFVTVSTSTIQKGGTIGEIQVWDRTRGYSLISSRATAELGSVVSMAFSVDHVSLLVSFGGAGPRRYNLTNGAPGTPIGNQSWHNALIAASPVDDRIMIGSDSGFVLYQGNNDATPARVLSQAGNGVALRGVIFTPDGQGLWVLDDSGCNLAGPLVSSP
jgi:WD40 repeat protein